MTHAYKVNAKLIKRKYLMTLMAFVFASTVCAQNITYNPDIDGDNMIGVTDLLQLLGMFGSEGNGTGVWGGSSNWTNVVETYSCTDTMAVVTNQEPKALILYMYESAVNDFAIYMNENGSNFYGVEFVTYPENGFDIDLMLSWSGWTNRPDAFAISVDVPQVSGGIDSYGNVKIAHVFETVYISIDESETTQLTVLVPQSVMPTSTSVYNNLNYDINEGQSACVSTNTISNSMLGCYTGIDFAHGHYRMYWGQALHWGDHGGYLRGGFPSEGE
tara:strand:- start:51 stop:869 length:819 start_codon:yes stop_codon:yes gene_type:complete